MRESRSADRRLMELRSCSNEGELYEIDSAREEGLLLAQGGVAMGQGINLPVSGPVHGQQRRRRCSSNLWVEAFVHALLKSWTT